MHTQRERPTRRDLGWIRSRAATCREQDAGSLIDLQLGDCGTQQTRAIVARLRQRIFTAAREQDWAKPPRPAR